MGSLLSIYLKAYAARSTTAHIDRFTRYSQLDKRWAHNLKYSPARVARRLRTNIYSQVTNGSESNLVSVIFNNVEINIRKSLEMLARFNTKTVCTFSPGNEFYQSVNLLTSTRVDNRTKKGRFHEKLAFLFSVQFRYLPFLWQWSLFLYYS